MNTSFRRDPSKKQNDPCIEADGGRLDRLVVLERTDQTTKPYEVDLAKATLSNGSLAIINDDDYGIAGGRTQIVVLRGTDIVRD